MAKSEKYLLQELEEARHAALEAARAKSEFLATISHEIRTPLTAILGMAELIQETPLNPEQKNYIRLLQKAGESLHRLINDILDYTKAESGQLVLEKAPFDLAEVIDAAIEITSLKAQDRGLKIVKQVAANLPLELIGDAIRLRQVLANLLSNAVKFTSQGKIILRVAKDPNSSDETMLLFSVTDSGIGIAQDKHEMIFEKFTQADSGTTRKYGGTGLGLAICKRFVEKMGGKIWVESHLNQGSTFYFTAPLEPQVTETLRELLPTHDLRGWKVLLVDDSPTERKMLKKILNSWNAVIEEVADAPQGAEKLKYAQQTNTAFSLILFDMRMQPSDGFQFAETITDAETRSKIIMMMPENHRKGDLRRCRDLGLGGYLIKPVDYAALYATVEIFLTAKHMEENNIYEVMLEGAAAKILIVDDSDDNRVLMQSYLKRTKYSCDVADSGFTALQKFHDNHYDLIIMDMCMPEMDGYAVTRAIRRLEKTSGVSAVPILALTASVLDEDAYKSIQAGCNAHLTKPINKKKLLDVIEKFINSKKLGMIAKDVETLLSALDQCDFKTIKTLGHRLVGIGQGYGLETVSDLGEMLEKAAKATDLDEAAKLVAELSSYLQKLSLSQSKY